MGLPARNPLVHHQYAVIPPPFQSIETEAIENVKMKLHSWVNNCPTNLKVKKNSPEHPVWVHYWSKTLHEPYEPQQVQFLQTILFAISKRVQHPGISDNDYSDEVIGLTRWFLGDDKCDSHIDGLPEIPQVINESTGKIEGGILLRWQVDNNRQNPLFYQAASRGRVPIVKYYTQELEIDANQEDTASQTPIFYAARDGNVPVIEYLSKDCGANLNHTDAYKQSALFYAAKNLRKEAVTCMITLGADVLLRDVQKKTAANWTDDQSIKTILNRAQRGQQKRATPAGGKTAGAPSAKRRRCALTFSSPDHVRWDSNQGVPIIYDPDSQEQMYPCIEEFKGTDSDDCNIILKPTILEKVPYRTTSSIPLMPMASELEILERQIPSVAIWRRDWPSWGRLPEEIKTKRTNLINSTITKESNATEKDESGLDPVEADVKVHVATSLTPFRAYWMNELKKIIQALLYADTNNWFSRPVDPIQDQCTDYNHVITRPMDFGTIKKKLNDGK